MWGATAYPVDRCEELVVSIHAPHVGCDYRLALLPDREMGFQFTHPMWGATTPATHSARYSRSFNSRTPCGVRPTMTYTYFFSSSFQFTHPVRGATISPEAKHARLCVSIHTPRAGCDHSARCSAEHSLLVSIHTPRAGCDTLTMTLMS